MAYSVSMRAVVPKWVVGSLLGMLFIGMYAIYHTLTKNSATGLDYTQNYKIVFQKPENWNEEIPSLSTLFVYQEPKTRAILRGGVTQIVSDFNPTPELDTDGIADYYKDTTENHQPGWTVERMPDIETQNLRFSILDRRHPGKRILTCFCVKGNTTLVVGLSAYGQARDLLDDKLADLKSFLSKIQFVPTRLHFPSDDVELASNSPR